MLAFANVGGDLLISGQNLSCLREDRQVRVYRTQRLLVVFYIYIVYLSIYGWFGILFLGMRGKNIVRFALCID